MMSKLQRDVVVSFCGIEVLSHAKPSSFSLVNRWNLGLQHLWTIGHHQMMLFVTETAISGME